MHPDAQTSASAGSSTWKSSSPTLNASRISELLILFLKTSPATLQRKLSSLCLWSPSLNHSLHPHNHKCGEDHKLTNKFAFATTDMHSASTSLLTPQQSVDQSILVSLHLWKYPLLLSSLFLRTGQNLYLQQWSSCWCLLGSLGNSTTFHAKGTTFCHPVIRSGKTSNLFESFYGWWVPWITDLSIFGGAGWETMSKSQSHRYLATGSVPGSGPVNT